MSKTNHVVWATRAREHLRGAGPERQTLTCSVRRAAEICGCTGHELVENLADINRELTKTGWKVEQRNDLAILFTPIATGSATPRLSSPFAAGGNATSYDPVEVASAARDYQANERAAGRRISTQAALDHVLRERGIDAKPASFEQVCAATGAKVVGMETFRPAPANSAWSLGQRAAALREDLRRTGVNISAQVAFDRVLAEAGIDKSALSVPTGADAA